MIEARQLAKSFSARIHGARTRINAVVDVGFDAPDGAITALLGPNGAGKTTTLRMIGTLVEPDAGRIIVGGVDVRATRAR
jgi:sodium transport system ATP-binding protein